MLLRIWQVLNVLLLSNKVPTLCTPLALCVFFYLFMSLSLTLPLHICGDHMTSAERFAAIKQGADSLYLSRALCLFLSLSHFMSLSLTLSFHLHIIIRRALNVLLLWNKVPTLCISRSLARTLSHSISLALCAFCSHSSSTYIHICIWEDCWVFRCHPTRCWPMLLGGEDPYLKLQVIFRIRATYYLALLRKMTCIDTAIYGSSLPCISLTYLTFFLSRALYRFLTLSHCMSLCPTPSLQIYIYMTSVGYFAAMGWLRFIGSLKS